MMDAEKSAVVETSSVSAKSPDSYLSGWQLAAVIFSLFLGVFVVSLDTSIIGVVIPSISSHFHALDDAAWYGSAYLLTITAFQPLMGSMYKFFKVELVFQICLVVFEGLSSIADQGVNAHLRLLRSSGLNPVRCGHKLGHVHRRSRYCWHWGSWYPPRCPEHYRDNGCLGEATALSGHRDQRLCNFRLCWPCIGWRLYHPRYLALVFLDVGISISTSYATDDALRVTLTSTSNVPIGGVTLILLLFVLRIRNAANDNRSLPLKVKLQHMDPIGCVVFIGAVCCLLLALQWGGQTKPWHSATIIGLFVGFGLLSILFVGIQVWRKERALIPLRVLRQRSIWTSGGVLFCLGSATYAVSSM
ncbi:unnamed protein product [Aspergillus oryzae var. brunneus]|uniref:Unnamed protein product n=1 Tax=Aspergillus oryzae var. brunneus TaxID=332754 RepID=A0ABQ6L9C1_ASPOZ|nr:unnamed protein product [Aspergillus oryzae var. brunneus]